MSNITFPDKPNGRPSANYYDQVAAFANDLQEVQSRLSFKMSARGWAYFLENEGVITKTEIDYAEGLVNKLRKNDFGKTAPWDHALLPVDFTAMDDSRDFECVETVHYEDATNYIQRKLKSLLSPTVDLSFWENQEYYLEVLVEKVDLKEIFKPVCRDYNIPIATASGWSSINQRAAMLRRFWKWSEKGKTPVLLYCGDFDPAGKQISDTLPKNFSDLEEALIPHPSRDEYVYGLSPDNIGLTVDRFGLNYDQVQSAGLPWIENLETSGDHSLDDPGHEDHDQDYVQEWLQRYGARKVEANALVTDPDLGRDLFRETVAGYLGENPDTARQEAEAEERRKIAEELEKLGLDKAIQDALSENGGDSNV